ncbi:acyl-CoA thioester hydrolase, YbgC/YbaW family [Acetitomaculum ruminis DSM 5522]|uniref:Acyl-CoA thioester hydrolase, YbgC/YbaW family n=1 Tax=Acetitomaculum ruminis DSM 5522 TaxID=1120918 RepID=A0A1I0XE83_9FIRM|nr:acyl-ACP thioesterase domain-containing protein [Acetitomaculum ruminis]SFA98243.1 acyl-CoA thioester hydrolase, YbgC/YbaW family [Acetitomaculum ruminis DSM 5522]
MYSFKSRVRYSEIDKDGIVTFPAIIDYFQDCVTFQSEDLNIGLKYLKEKKRAWVVAFWQVDVLEMPEFSREIIINTWPYELNGFMGYRNFTITDAKSNRLLVRANSVWVCMDTEKKRPVKIDIIEKEKYELEEKFPMEYASRKLSIPENLQFHQGFIVESFQLDTNGHMNNSQYIRAAWAYKKSRKKIFSLRTEYVRSARLGETIYPKTMVSDDKEVIVLCGEGDIVYAIVELIYQKEKDFRLKIVKG